MSSTVKFIPCDEDSQIYHYQRTNKKYYLKEEVTALSKKSKEPKPGKGMPPKKKVQNKPRKGKK